LKVIGVFFTALHSLGLLGIGTSIMALVAKKIHQRLGLAFLLISSAVLALSHQIIPLKVTKGVFLMGQQVSMAALGGLMETFYRPILAQAKADGIPILDLPNTFNPYDSSLYIAQIEPSQKGGQLIAEGLDHIIKHHDFTSSKSLMYSKRDSNQKFTATENPGSSGWSVAYPTKRIHKSGSESRREKGPARKGEARAGSERASSPRPQISKNYRSAGEQSVRGRALPTPPPSIR
ncbi:MAG TPA: hypothetical protein VFU89_02670, partial [Rhabdochlamydiaceae bacterium]|nr:hypothetical protein [Rhabdochlamydiaceae bacterium]